MLGDPKDNGRITVEIRNRSYVRVLDSVVPEEKKNEVVVVVMVKVMKKRIFRYIDVTIIQCLSYSY